MRHVRPAFLLFAFVAVTLPLMPLQQLFVWLWPAMAEKFPHYYHRLLARILGIRVTVSGPRPIHGAAFIVSNHVSWIDIIVLSVALPVSFVAKNEIGRWPFFGALARLQRTVFVDRSRRHNTGDEADAISMSLKQGAKVVLFAEGTSSNGRAVLPFRTSYFAAVHDPAIPVVPVTLAYRTSWGLPISPHQMPRYAWYGDMDLPPHLWNALAEGPLGVDVIFHPAETLAHAKLRKHLAAHAENTIRHSLVAALNGRKDPR
jgi:1-acyl-sn-glycerol-3-phosphate acyltransferase